MNKDLTLTEASWQSGEEPLILGDIFRDGISVALWQREPMPEVSDYFTHVFDALGLGVRSVLSLETLKEQLADSLPDHQGKQAAIDDIYLLSDMLCCLFDCDTVGLRLVPLNKAMCPSFHVDNIPVRLVSTYLGDGTQWLPQEALVLSPNDNDHSKLGKTKAGFYYQQDNIQQMKVNDVGLLKGQAWDETQESAALHRSCPVDDNGKRVLLTLDPM